MRKTTSSNFQNQRVLAGVCPLNDVLYRIGMRWKMQVLFFIHEGFDTFGALKKRLPDVSDQILGKRLRELVVEELVRKQEALATGPLEGSAARGAPRTCYAATERGVALLQIMRSICAWELDDLRPRGRVEEAHSDDADRLVNRGERAARRAVVGERGAAAAARRLSIRR